MQRPAMPLPDPEYDAAFYDGVPAKRLFAWIIDLILVLILSLVLSLLSFGLLFVIFPATFAGVSFIYRVGTIARSSATPGMRLMNIELRNAQGRYLSLGEAAIHTLVFMIASAMMVIQLISMGMMATGARGQGLHDMSIGSVAINRPS